MTLDDLERKCIHLTETEERDLRDIGECRRMEAIDTLTGAARIATPGRSQARPRAPARDAGGEGGGEVAGRTGA